MQSRGFDRKLFHGYLCTVELALSIEKSAFVFWSVFHLQTHQEIAEHLVFAFPVLGLGWIAEKSTELVVAESEPTQGKDVEHVFILVIERDAEFAEDEVVVE